MRARLASLVALLCLACLAAPAAAPAAVAKNVKRVLADYRNDGKIDPCRHSAKDLRDTLKAVEGNTEQYAPDFPAAVEAALQERKTGDCREEEATPTPTPTPTPSATPAPAPPAPAAPAAPAAPVAPAPEAPADEPAVEPAEPETTPAPTPTEPPAQETAPAPVAPGAGITPGTPTPSPADREAILERAAARNDTDLGPAPWIVLGGLLGASLLAGLLVLAMRRFGWGEERLAPVVHAVGEAGYRTGGTWQAFTDWVRRGR